MLCLQAPTALGLQSKTAIQRTFPGAPQRVPTEGDKIVSNASPAQATAPGDVVKCIPGGLVGQPPRSSTREAARQLRGGR